MNIERIPTASIGLPVYNGEQFLEKAVRSILTQSFTDFELVISDNASTDRTEEICEAYAAQDSRVRYFRQDENLGAASNYNFVFAESRAEYFKWAAHDDMLAPEFLGKCVEALENHPEYVLCYTRTELIDEHDRPVHMEEGDLELGAADTGARFYRSLRPMKLCHNPVFGVIRRSALAKTRLISPHLASDRRLVAELALSGPFYRIPERLFIRRRHPESIGTSRSHLSFYDPSLSAVFVLPEHRLLWEYLVSVRRAPLSLAEKARLGFAVLRWGATRRVRFWEELYNGLTDVLVEYLPAPIIQRVRRIKHGKRSRASMPL